MTPAHDPLEDGTGEAIPTSPARRRVALTVGILLLVLILGVLIWFIVTNTETVDDHGTLFGLAGFPGTLLS